jgi:hypothetical protein
MQRAGKGSLASGREQTSCDARAQCQVWFDSLCLLPLVLQVLVCLIGSDKMM